LHGVYGLDHHRSPDAACLGEDSKLVDIKTAAQLGRGPLKPVMATLDGVPNVKMGVDYRS
jgi:hypothetical protein